MVRPVIRRKPPSAVHLRVRLPASQRALNRPCFAGRARKASVIMKFWLPPPYLFFYPRFSRIAENFLCFACGGLLQQLLDGANQIMPVPAQFTDTIPLHFLHSALP